MTQKSLIELAKGFIKENHPEWESELSLAATIEDRDSYWEISFELPELTLGGVPVVEIDKTLKRVTRAYHTQ